MLVEQRLFFLQALVGEIAHDEADAWPAPARPRSIRMQKALLALGGFRRAGVFRQAIDDGGGDLDRVLHLALGKTGMGRDALDGDGGAIGREGFVLDMARGLAVDGVGEIGAELFQIGLVDAAADLLVGREQDLDGAVLDLGMRRRGMRAASMISARPALLSAPSSVVPSVVTMSLPIWSASAGWSAARITCGGIARQHDVAAAIIPDDLRLDVRCRCNRARCPYASRSRSPAPSCPKSRGWSHRHSRARRDARRQARSPAIRWPAGGRDPSASRWTGRSARPDRTGCR